MSNLLLRLGERAIGVSTNAQPLLRPSFAAHQPLTEPVGVDAESSEVPARSIPVTAAMPDDGGPAQIVKPFAAQPPAKSETRQESFHPDVVASETAPTLPSMSPALERGAASKRKDQTFESHDLEDRSAIEGVSESSSGGRVAERALGHRPTLADVMSRLYPEQATATSSASKVNLDDDVDSFASTSTRASTSATQLPSFRPAKESATERHLRPDRTQAGDTRSVTEVQVTIGKIELHAAAPAAPTQPAIPSRSTLSLDAYLARRRGERA